MSNHFIEKAKSKASSSPRSNVAGKNPHEKKKFMIFGSGDSLASWKIRMAMKKDQSYQHRSYMWHLGSCGQALEDSNKLRTSTPKNSSALDRPLACGTNWDLLN